MKHSLHRRGQAAVVAVVALFGAGTLACRFDSAHMQVIAVANNVSGTVTFLDTLTYRTLGSINIVPDLHERLAEISADPFKGAAYPLMKQLQTLKVREPGQGDAAGNRFADDLMFSPD